MRFQEEDETVTFYRYPLPNLQLPSTGAHWGHPGNCHEQFYSSPNKVSTHYITWLFSFWIWRRRCLKFAKVLALGGHTYYLNNFESPAPKDDSCQVWLKSNYAFSRKRWKCKKFTDDTRRTKTDGNSSPWAYGSGELKNHKIVISGWLLIAYLFFIWYIGRSYWVRDGAHCSAIILKSMMSKLSSSKFWVQCRCMNCCFVVKAPANAILQHKQHQLGQK